MNYNYKTALAEQIDDMAIELDEIRQDRERLIKENNELEEERDLLAYENENMAGFIKYNDSTLTNTDIGDIACGTPDVWDRFINESANHMLEQNKTIRELNRENCELRDKAEYYRKFYNKSLQTKSKAKSKLIKIKNICNNMEMEDL